MPSKDDELKRLVAQVQQSTRTPARAASMRRRNPNTKGNLTYLYAAMAVVLVGVAVIVVWPEVTTVVEEAPIQPASPVPAAGLLPTEIGYKGSLRSDASAPLPGDDSEKEPRPKPLPVSSLKRLFDGKTLLTVSCFLKAKLDAATEEDWRAAGMLNEQADITRQAFVLKVTIANADSLEMLNDWHVEGILPESAK